MKLSLAIPNEQLGRGWERSADLALNWIWRLALLAKEAPKLDGFYVDLRKQDSSVYKRASYIAAQGALQRHLTSLDRTFSIYKDKEFVKANSVLDRVLKQNKKSGLEEGVDHKRALSAEDWDLVHEYFKKVSTSSDPVSLCRYVWFVVSIHFCLREHAIVLQPSQ